jgi:phage terminase large subunit-like protein
MFVEAHEIIFGTSTKRETAKFSWRQVIKMAENSEILMEDLDPIHTRETIGEESFFNNLGSNYMFAAPNRNAGRSYTVNRGLLDELRDHKSWDTYDALINAGNAVFDFQTVAITNQGDATAVVLDTKRDEAIEFIDTGEGNSSLFLAEYSAPPGCDPTDPEALAMANPNLGIRIPIDALMGEAIGAKKKGGDRLARFRTEVLCQRVHLLNPAIEPEIWKVCGFNETEEKKYPKLGEFRRSLVLCLDMSLTADHATLVGVAEVNGMYYCGVLKAWHGPDTPARVRAELPDLVEMVKPRAFGWFPKGPAAVIAADLKLKPRHNKPWPPKSVKIVEFKAEDVPAICMGLADVVHSLQMYHPKDDLLTSHIENTQKLERGDVWTFTRAGSKPVDATYALAGAVHLIRTLPAPLKPVSTGRSPDGSEEFPF